MSIDPRRLLILRAVRRTGGVLAAAQALHLTPSGISQHLARLEAETGLELIDRTRRGGGRTVQLTAAGRTLSDHADRVADALAAAERETGWLKSKATGAVRVGGFGSVLKQLVAPVVAAMDVTHPEVETQVFEVDDESGLADLRAGRLDVLLSERVPGASPAPGSDLIETDLMRDPYRIVVPGTWTVDDERDTLLSGAWVAAPPPQPSRLLLERLCTKAGIALDARHICIESPTMLALVAAGLGAAVIPDLTLAYQPQPGVRVTAGILDPGARILTTLRSRTTSETPATDLFLQELQYAVAARGDVNET